MRQLKSPSGEGPSAEKRKSQTLKKKPAVSSSASFLDRFSFANAKPKHNRTERIRAQRNRSQVRSWFIAISLSTIGLAVAISIALGLHQKIYDATKEKLIHMSGHIGLDVRDVFVEGRKNAALDIIMAATQVTIKTPILAYDIDAICANLFKIDWVKTATVQRRLPNLLYIKLVERQPIALWQQKGIHYLVDNDGVIIKSPVLDAFKLLPIVAGVNAPAHTPKLLALLERFITVRKHLSAMIRIRERRWDITLDGSITVKLPEDGLEDALARLSILLDEQKITPGDVLSVDLRMPKQVIMRLTPTAAVRVKIRGKERV